MRQKTTCISTLHNIANTANKIVHPEQGFALRKFEYLTACSVVLFNVTTRVWMLPSRKGCVRTRVDPPCTKNHRLPFEDFYFRKSTFIDDIVVTFYWFRASQMRPSPFTFVCPAYEEPTSQKLFSHGYLSQLVHRLEKQCTCPIGNIRASSTMLKLLPVVHPATRLSHLARKLIAKFTNSGDVAVALQTKEEV